MGLIDDAADWFKHRDAPVIFHSDDTGRYAFTTGVNGQKIIVAPKTRLHDGMASFMAGKVVQRAINSNALLCQFTGDGDRLLFDPHTVATAGDHRTVSDKRKRRGERWVDIDTDLSVTLHDWVEYGDTPAPVEDFTPDEDGRPARPWDVTEWGDDDD